MLFAPNKPNLPGRAGRDGGTKLWGVGQVNKQDAYDKSRGGEKFTISLYVIWIYVIFCVDRPGAGFIL